MQYMIVWFLKDKTMEYIFDFHIVRNAVRQLKKNNHINPTFSELSDYLFIKYKDSADVISLSKQILNIIAMAVSSAEIIFDKNNRLKIPTIKERIKTTEGLFKEEK